MDAGLGPPAPSRESVLRTTGPGQRPGFFLFFANLIAALMFTAVFVIFCVKILARYIGHNEMAWADEVSIVLFIWIIFWANAFILADRDHIRFDLLTHAAPPSIARLLAFARALLTGGIFLYATPATLDYIHFLWRERTPVLGLRLDIIYACFGLFILTVPLRAAQSIIRLSGKNWRTWL